MAKQSSMVSIPVADARALFLAMSFQTAGDWPLERLAEKLEELETIVDDEVRDELGEDELATVDKVLAGIEQGAKIVVDDGSPVPKTKKEKKAEKAVAAAKVGVDQMADTPEAEDQEDPVAETDSTQEASTDKKPVAVRLAKTRPFVAGQVIRGLAGCNAEESAEQYEKRMGHKPISEEQLGQLRLCLAPGCPEDVFVSIESGYGKSNMHETTFAARNAWHAIRGFLEAVGSE